MQNIKQELNANAVGANCIRLHFGEMTLKKQKGITLIALIITIIVMLILVGVTINVALNGGLFKKAEEAKTGTQMASEKEQLMIAAVGAFNVNTGVDFDNFDLPEGFEELSRDATKAVYKGPSGNQYEVIKETGKVEEGSKDDDGENTPPENITSTIWQQRGLTSSDVKYNTLYYGEGLDFPDSTDVTMALGLYSNGDICIDLGNDEPTSKLDSTGTGNFLGNAGLLSSELQTYIDLGGIPIDDNGFTFEHEGVYIKCIFTNNNTIKVYAGTGEDLDDNGNVPQTEEFFAGTLYELDL